MKKFFSYFGILMIMLFSFFYTEKTVSVVKEYDEIMIEIKKYDSKYRKEPYDCIIDNNRIVPGINGYKINIDKSYSNMRRYGKFNSNLIELEVLEPNIKLKNNLDKYIISGNKISRSVSLIFLVDKDIRDILDILGKENVSATFFVDNNWIESNNELFSKLIDLKHIIGNKENELSPNFFWNDTVIKNLTKQKNGYCFFSSENNEFLNLCSFYNNYSIFTNVIEKNPYNEVKNNLNSGSFFAFKINSEVINELPVIISFIKSRGYNIKNLNDILNE